jgi:hypothetical protein
MHAGWKPALPGDSRFFNLSFFSLCFMHTLHLSRLRATSYINEVLSDAIGINE